MPMVHIYSMAGPRHALKVRDQGHGLMKCAVGVGVHVDMIA